MLHRKRLPQTLPNVPIPPEKLHLPESQNKQQNSRIRSRRHPTPLQPRQNLHTRRQTRTQKKRHSNKTTTSTRSRIQTKRSNHLHTRSRRKKPASPKTIPEIRIQNQNTNKKLLRTQPPRSKNDKKTITKPSQNHKNNSKKDKYQETS